VRKDRKRCDFIFDLLQQLLTFAHRGVTTPEIVDLNIAISGMTDVLHNISSSLRIHIFFQLVNATRNIMHVMLNRNLLTKTADFG